MLTCGNMYTTTSEVVKKGNKSNAQLIVDRVTHWSTVNRVKLNIDKCKELRISLRKTNQIFIRLLLMESVLEVVKSACEVARRKANN
jgi:hypothetical protein